MDRLYEQAILRVEKLHNISRVSFAKSHEKIADQIFDALNFAKSDLETSALTNGILIYEKVGPDAVAKAVETLKSDPRFSLLQDTDIRDLVQFFIDQNAGAIVFAPEVLAKFIDFCKNVGFPTTYGGAEKGGLEAPRYSTTTLLRVLVGANVLTVFQVPGVEALDAKHSSDEDAAFKENPKVKVDVYELDRSFLRELSHVLRILGVKEECISKVSFLNKIEEKREIGMGPGKTLEEIEKKIDCLLEATKGDDDEEEKEEKPQEKEVETGRHETSFFKQMTDDVVEKFVDGLLIVLGELEQTGAIDKVDSPDEARDAVLAAIRRMYQKRGLVSRLSRKYSRFGAKRVLRKGKQDISKALR